MRHKTCSNPNNCTIKATASINVSTTQKEKEKELFNPKWFANLFVTIKIISCWSYDRTFCRNLFRSMSFCFIYFICPFFAKIDDKAPYDEPKIGWVQRTKSKLKSFTWFEEKWTKKTSQLLRAILGFLCIFSLFLRLHQIYRHSRWYPGTDLGLLFRIYPFPISY